MRNQLFVHNTTFYFIFIYIYLLLTITIIDTVNGTQQHYKDVTIKKKSRSLNTLGFSIFK